MCTSVASPANQAGRDAAETAPWASPAVTPVDATEEQSHGDSTVQPVAANKHPVRWPLNKAWPSNLWMPWKKHSASGSKRVLNPLTLRFFRSDFEGFYMDHHWAHMRYWLWWCVTFGLLYVAALIVFGDELIARTFDVRMDHYARSSPLTETPPWVKEAVSNATTQEEALMWNSVKVIQLDDQNEMMIPRAGFLAWHLMWTLDFFMILLADRFMLRCCSERCKKVWRFARTWIVFFVMFLDSVITAFLNPSVTRFMMFVYALLIRAQFVQTVVLVCVSSLALLSAGYIGSHGFLNSISVAEFLVLDLVCLSAARQTEIHARLSLYRLWYIMVKNKKRKLEF